MSEQPQFRLVRRGYAPDEVDATFTELGNALGVARRTAAQLTTDVTRSRESESELKARLDDALARLSAAEGDPPSRGRYEDLGPRVDSILRLALEEASQIVEAARHDSDTQLDTARATVAQATERRREVAQRLRQVVELLDRLDLQLSEPIGSARESRVAT